MQKRYEIVYSKKFVEKFKNILVNYYKYDTYMDFIIIPFLWQKTLMYIPLLSYSDRKSNEIEDLLELAKDNDYQIRTLNFEYNQFKLDDTVTMRINVEDIDETLDSLSKKTQHNISKSLKQGFKDKYGNSDKMVEDFYQIYAKTMHRLGTPALEKKFFYVLKDEFKDKIEFHNFYDKDKIIAGTCNIMDEEIGMFEWLGMDKQYQKKNLGYFIYYTLIKKNKNGLKILDFGRSAYQGGTYRFKNHFKMYPVKIDIFRPYEEDIYQKYQLASQIWKRLPFRVVNKMGWICKYLKDL